MPLGPLVTLVLVAITGILAAFALNPLRRGISSNRQRAGVVAVAASSWFALWPVVPDWGLKGMTGGFFLLGWLIFFMPGAAMGLVAGVGLARESGWGRWLGGTWAVVSLAWGGLILVGAFSCLGDCRSDVNLLGLVYLFSHLALVGAAVLTLFLIAQDRGVR